MTAGLQSRLRVRSDSMRLQPLPRVDAMPWPLRPPVLAWRALCALLLRYQIWETEHYLRDCEREGLTDSLSLRDFRAQLQALRVRLIDLNPRS